LCVFVCVCVCVLCVWCVCVCVVCGACVFTAGNHYKNLWRFLDVCLFNQLTPINTHEWQSAWIYNAPPLTRAVRRALSRHISMTSCVFRCIHHFSQMQEVCACTCVCVSVLVCVSVCVCVSLFVV